MAGEREPTKRLDRRAAWTAKMGGYGAAAIGVLAAEALIVPGLLIGTGGLIYENVTDPKKKEQRKINQRGTIYQRVKTIVTLGAK